MPRVVSVSYWAICWCQRIASSPISGVLSGVLFWSVPSIGHLYVVCYLVCYLVSSRAPGTLWLCVVSCFRCRRFALHFAGPCGFNLVALLDHRKVTSVCPATPFFDPSLIDSCSSTSTYCRIRTPALKSFASLHYPLHPTWSHGCRSATFWWPNRWE